MGEIVENLSIQVGLDAVLRYLGYRPEQQVLSAAIRELAGEEISRGIRLFSARAVFDTWDIQALAPEAMGLDGAPLVLQGKGITRHLSGAAKATVLAVTVGEAVERQIGQLFATGEYGRAVILDAVASEGAEMAAEAVNRIIDCQAEAAGYRTLSRFSPGYGDWDLRVQGELLSVVEAGRIGMTVNSGSMLLPRKSVTAVVGWVQGEKGASAPVGCRNCSLPGCLYRHQEVD